MDAAYSMKSSFTRAMSDSALAGVMLTTADLSEFDLSEPRDPLILPRRIENRLIERYGLAEPHGKRGVICEIVVGQRMDQRVQPRRFEDSA